MAPSAKDLRQLFKASERGDLAKVQELVRSGATGVNTPDEGGCTALHYAARSGHFETAQYLVRRGASLVAKTALWGHTPLHWAAHHGRLAVGKYLVKHLRLDNAGVDTPCNSGDTPLVMAACADHVSMCRLLLENGADLHHRGADALTAVQWAAKKRLPNTVEFLVSRGANVEDAGASAEMGGVSVREMGKKWPEVLDAVDRGLVRWKAREERRRARRHRKSVIAIEEAARKAQEEKMAALQAEKKERDAKDSGENGERDHTDDEDGNESDYNDDGEDQPGAAAGGAETDLVYDYPEDTSGWRGKPDGDVVHEEEEEEAAEAEAEAVAVAELGDSPDLPPPPAELEDQAIIAPQGEADHH